MPAGKRITLFGKPYLWLPDIDGRLALHPALRLDQSQQPDAPFSGELVRAAMGQLRAR